MSHCLSGKICFTDIREGRLISPQEKTVFTGIPKWNLTGCWGKLRKTLRTIRKVLEKLVVNNMGCFSSLKHKFCGRGLPNGSFWTHVQKCDLLWKSLADSNIFHITRKRRTLPKIAGTWYTFGQKGFYQISETGVKPRRGVEGRFGRAKFQTAWE